MKGWAERMNIEIAKILDADIATAVWSSECYNARSMGFQWEIFEVDTGFQKWMLGFLKMKWKFFQSSNITKNYNSILFSNEAITGIWNTKPGTKTYYYAHSISRHLFDQRDQYLTKAPLFARPFFLIFSVFLRWLYKKELSKVGTIFVNSEANKLRISDWCGRSDAIVIYPSVDTEKFDIFSEESVSQILVIEWFTAYWRDQNEIFQKQEVQGGENFSKWAYNEISVPQEYFQCDKVAKGHLEKSLSDGEIRSFSDISYKDYYLSFARLTHAKRIDMIIRAFAKMPDKNIVILYGENDSQKDEFMELGKWYPNIVFHKLVENSHLPYIINWAIASICISSNEDFGMVAIESMACGVPVIAVDEWGYRESIARGKSGYLIDPENLESNLVTIVNSTSPEIFANMEWACRTRSLDFSITMMNIAIARYMK